MITEELKHILDIACKCLDISSEEEYMNRYKNPN